MADVYKTAFALNMEGQLQRQLGEAVAGLRAMDRAIAETQGKLNKMALGKGIFEGMAKLKAEFGGIAATAVHGNQQIIASYAAMGGKLATEMRGLKGVSAEVAGAMNREFKGALGGLSGEISAIERRMAELQGRMRSLGGGGRSIRHPGSGIVDTIAMGPQHSGVYAGLNVEHGLVGGLLQANGELQRQLNLYRLGGAKESDVAAARSAAFRSAVMVPDVGVAEQAKLLRELSGATGDEAGARTVLPQVAKTMSIMEAVTGRKSEEDMKRLFKFIELRGVAIDEATHKIDVGKFGGELDYATKAMVAAQGLITSNDMLQFTKQAGPMAKGMSGEDLFTTMLAAIEDMGGSRAGTSLTAVGRQFLGGIMTGGKAQRLKELGLLNAAGTETSDQGGIKITDPTKAIVGYDVLTKSGFGAFMEQVIRPHMQEHGITGRQQQNEELYRSVGTDTARRLMGLYLSGHEQVGIVADRYRKAMSGGEGYDKIFGSGQDLQTSTKALHEAFTTLKTALGDAPAVSSSLMTLARGVASVADMVKDHPALGTAATLGGVGASASLLGFGALQTLKGFGLPAAAAELTTAAKMLQAAAGGQGGVPGQPGSKPGLWGTLAGALGLYTLAEGAQANNVLAAPKAGDGFWKNVLNFLDPGLAARVIGDGIKKPAEEAGKAAGSATTKGFGSEDYQGAGSAAGTSLLRGFLNIFSQMGANGVQPTSFGGGGLGGLIQTASFGANDNGSFGGTSGVARALGRAGTGGIVPRGAFGPGTGAGNSWYEAIMRAEGTAGKDPYNVVLGNGRYGLPSKPLTDMTLAEAYAFGRTVRARHGSSSALGAFQIVGRTMKGFMGEAGLSWNDKFSPENQRKLADVIRRHQGFGAWEGFKVHPGELRNARQMNPYGKDPAPTAGPPPRSQQTVHVHNLIVDGKKMAAVVTTHQANKMLFPTRAGAMDTHGEWRPPGTPVTDAA